MEIKTFARTAGLVALGLAASTLSFGEDHGNATTMGSPITRVNLRGNELRILTAYLPPEDRHSYRDMMTLDVVRLSLDWPSLKPFVPTESEMIHIRTRTELSVVFDPSGARDNLERVQFFERVRNDWTAKYNLNDDRFGLRRLSLIEGASSPFNPDDVMFPANGPLLTLIRCAPESEIEPNSPEVKQLWAAKKLVNVPLCTQHFFIPELKNVVVRVTYRRIYLNDWKNIEKRLSELTRSMLVHGATRR